MDPRVLKAYLNHFLPREVFGPVIIVFSLEGVIDGLFHIYVPEQYEIVGWGIIFLISLVGIAYWGVTDEQGLEELEDRLDEIQNDGAATADD